MCTEGQFCLGIDRHIVFSSLATVPRTCHEVATVYRNIFPASGEFKTWIDPDGDGGESPFIATCVFDKADSRVASVIRHNHEARTLVNGFEPVGSYGVTLTYEYAGPSQIIALVNASSSCKQSIKYECLGSQMTYGYWVSRSGDKMGVWPSANLAGGKKYCDSKSTKCECDKNDIKWRVQQGFVENNAARTLNSLPIKAVHFGDTGSASEQGYHTIGPLMCY